MVMPVSSQLRISPETVESRYSPGPKMLLTAPLSTSSPLVPGSITMPRFSRPGRRLASIRMARLPSRAWRAQWNRCRSRFCPQNWQVRVFSGFCFPHCGFKHWMVLGWLNISFLSFEYRSWLFEAVQPGPAGRAKICIGFHRPGAGWIGAAPAALNWQTLAIQTASDLGHPVAVANHHLPAADSAGIHDDRLPARPAFRRGGGCRG
jgi:hypothetical protein